MGADFPGAVDGGGVEWLETRRAAPRFAAVLGKQSPSQPAHPILPCVLHSWADPALTHDDDNLSSRSILTGDLAYGISNHRHKLGFRVH